MVRALPRVRGRGRLGKIINDALLRGGADPAAVVKMSAGHSLAIDCRLFSHSNMLFSGVSGVEDLLPTLLAFLKPGGVALDVGANIGIVTVPLALAAKRAGARLIAFEPFPRNVEWIHKNLQLNHIDEEVTVVESGLSSEAGEATLLLREDFETGAAIGNASVAEPGIDEHFQRTTIRLSTLDALWPGFGSPRLDVIKIDIEGHEDRFLEGAKQTLAANRPVLLMEANRYYYDRRGISFEQAISPKLPPDYRYFVSGSREIKDLSECHDSDILLVPAEKAQLLRAS
jgi:FkbM family methyltransferase